MSRENNIANIKQLYLTALERTVEALTEEIFDAAVTEKNWAGFDHPTKRKNGDIVTNPRDIVDTGEFADGIESDGLNISFNAPHSLYVIKGHRTANGYVPGRDIINPALNKIKQSDRLKIEIDLAKEETI